MKPFIHGLLVSAQRALMCRAHCEQQQMIIENFGVKLNNAIWIQLRSFKNSEVAQRCTKWVQASVSNMIPKHPEDARPEDEQ